MATKQKQFCTVPQGLSLSSEDKELKNRNLIGLILVFRSAFIFANGQIYVKMNHSEVWPRQLRPCTARHDHLS